MSGLGKRLTMCNHENTVICQTEGDTVCIDCGLVVENFLAYHETHAFKNSSTTFCHNSEYDVSNDYFDIVHICSRFHLDDCLTISRIYEKYLKVKNEKKFKKEEIFSYVLYQFFKSESVPRSMKEISEYTCVSKNRLWKIERNQNSKLPSSTPQQLLETYYKHLDMSFKDRMAVSDLIESFKWSETSFAPSSICSGLCYFYCKKNKIPTSMRKIAAVFHVSVMSVHRFLKYYRSCANSQLLQ